MARPETDTASQRDATRSADLPSGGAAGAGSMPARVIKMLAAFRVAAALSAIWLFVVVAYAIGFFGVFGASFHTPRPAVALEIALFLLAAMGPVALFFYGALLARKAEDVRLAAARLTSAVDALRLATSSRSGPVADDLAEALARAARSTMAEDRAAVANAITRMDATLAETQAMVGDLAGRDSKARRQSKTIAVAEVEADEAQAVMPFVAEPAGAPSTAISWDSVVRALQFPNDEADEAGFEAIRVVVEDHDLAALLQAAEDVLSLMSEDGLYMEDVRPDIAPAPVWRRYAEGERGKDISQIGGIHDEVALAIARSLLRNDPVFRDTALHFLRRFDRLAERMIAELGEDQMVLEAADSRTGRAFMIVARVMGVFD